MNVCGCGSPRDADYYVCAIIGRDVDGTTETTYVDGYVCSGHMDDEPVLILTPDIFAEGWEILECSIASTGRFPLALN